MQYLKIIMEIKWKNEVTIGKRFKFGDRAESIELGIIFGSCSKVYKHELLYSSRYSWSA